MSVAQHDVAAAVLGYFGVVGDEDDGASFGMQLLEQYQNLERSTGVQVTRSFVCQDNGGIVHQGAGDGYALHLTAGHLIGLYVPVGRPAPRLAGASMARLRLSEAETEELYISGSSTFSTAVVLAAGCNSGIRNRFYGCVVRRVEALLMVRTEIPSSRFAAGGRVQAAEGIQQSRLSGARCTHDGDKLAFTDGERDAAQGMHGFVPTWKLRLIF